MAARKKELLRASLFGVNSELSEKKNQTRVDPELVICRKQRDYSSFHPSLLQNLYIATKSRFQLFLEIVKFWQYMQTSTLLV